jgi:hypothetical protein
MRVILDYDKELDGLNPSEVFAMTFAEAKFNSIVERGGTYSTVLKVARTGNNDRIFGMPSDNRSTSARPYTRFDCRVEENGLPFFYGVAVLEEAQDFYGLRIYSGTASFFQEYGDTDIRDLDLSALNHDWTAANVYVARNRLTGYCYPPINYGRWHSSVGSGRPHTDFFPAVYTKAILEAAALLGGYTLVDAADDWVLPFAKQDFSNERGVRFRSSAPSTTRNNLLTGGKFISGLTVVDEDPTSHAYTLVGSEVFEMVPDGVYDFEATVNYDADIGGQTFAVIVRSNAAASNYVVLSEYGQIFNGNGAVSIKANGVTYDAARPFVTIVFLTSTAPTHYVDVLEGSFLRCIQGVENIASGDGIHIADTLPALSVKDLFLFEAVRRNAYLLTDVNTKEIRFAPLSDITAKSPAAKDWTGKVDLSIKPKYSYRLPEYAQRNGLEWADGVEEDLAYVANPSIGNYFFPIDDQGLQIEKQLYGAKFAFSSVQVSFTDMVHLSIPRYSSHSLSYDEPDIDPKPRAVRVVANTDQAVPITGQGAMGTVRYGSPQTWQELYELNYAGFAEMFNRFKQVEVFVHLTALDIAELDFTQPIRLLGNTWIIREVKQWKVNRAGSTLVKLIRI